MSDGKRVTSFNGVNTKEGYYVDGVQVIDGSGNITATAGSIGTAEIADASVTPAKTIVAQARTATADGTGTGTISDSATFVTVTSDNADKIIVLPTPTPGREVIIVNGATGYELRSSAPGTVAINGGAGANAESAVAASQMLRAVCTSATTWVVNKYAAVGTESALEAAA